jgi:SAM-dependent methyltransferase
LWSIFLPATSESGDLLTCELWEFGTVGILEEHDGIRAFFADDTTVAQLPASFRNAAVRSEPEHPLTPLTPAESLCVGTRFFIAPADNYESTPEGRLRLTVPSSNAFGTGRHETTQLCLQALQSVTLSKRTVVDIGCGTGILSRAAELLEAGQVISCDIEEDAIAATLLATHSLLFMGSADALSDSIADIVIANITARALDVLAFDLKRILKPDGLLIASGFLTDAPPAQFSTESKEQLGDWECWICRRDRIIADHPVSPEGISHEKQWWL